MPGWTKYLHVIFFLHNVWETVFLRVSEGEEVRQHKSCETGDTSAQMGDKGIMESVPKMQ